MKTSRFILLALALSITVGTLKAQVSARVVEDGGTGKYSALMTTEATLPTHTIFRPKDLSGFGKKNKLPVIAWGNGACYDSPWEHVNFLNEVASHGFLVIAIGVMPKETGEQVKERSTSKNGPSCTSQ